MNIFKRCYLYCKRRWIKKTHALTSSLKRGDYHEFDERILFCLFDEYKKFIEDELTLDVLDWYIVGLSERDRDQSEFGVEAKKLYEWWTIERPKREEIEKRFDDRIEEGERLYGPMYRTEEIQGTNNVRVAFNENKKLFVPFTEWRELEKKWYDEDTEMLKRLIDIRCRLWT